MSEQREITVVVEGIMLALWRKGFDTFAIAKQLKIDEAAVYNRLLHLREALR